MKPDDISNTSYQSDQRRYIRYEVLDYAMLYDTEATEPVRVVIVDIGLGGLQLRSKEILKEGQTCYVHVGRDDKDPLRLKAEIRHSRLLESTDLVSTGIRFVPDTHEERMAIAEFVHGVFQRQCDLMNT